MTDMSNGYRPSGASDSFWDMFFPLTFFDVFITTFAVRVHRVRRATSSERRVGHLHARADRRGVRHRDSLPVLGCCGTRGCCLL